MNKQKHMNIYSDYNHIALKYKSRKARARGGFRSLVIYSIAIVITAYIFALVTARAIDIHFSNQDEMLCNSAKVSGNAEYLKKCQCYYNGDNIACIQLGGDEN